MLHPKKLTNYEIKVIFDIFRKKEKMFKTKIFQIIKNKSFLDIFFKFLQIMKIKSFLDVFSTKLPKTLISSVFMAKKCYFKCFPVLWP